MKKIKLLLTALLIIASACNKIDTSKDTFKIIGPVEVTPWDPEYAANVSRNIYVEEFTGHFCNNCPAGAREIKAIMEDHPSVVLTAIHSTNLADPRGGIYSNNYKTPMGDQICDYLLATKFIPKAAINRMLVSDAEWGFDRTQWRSVIDRIDITNVSAGIELQCTVDEVKQEIVANVAITIIKAIPNPVQICLILKQDGFISGQYDGNVHVPDYEHNHMLRAGFNGNFGTRLTPNGIVTPQLKYSTTFKLPYGDPLSFPHSNLPVVIKDCSVVAYLIDMETNEVLQVEYVHLDE
ncbi:MAG: Omp28-related outer membrane protein [Lentimicrobiaceae bacterium]|nr:Omp28-related outer membrane protein [Lentimicrobiaceae bacterium]